MGVWGKGMISGIVSRLFIPLPSIDKPPKGTSKSQRNWFFEVPLGEGHERLYHKPFIYNPSPNRQAPAGISKNQRSRLFFVPVGISKNQRSRLFSVPWAHRKS